MASNTINKITIGNHGNSGLPKNNRTMHNNDISMLNCTKLKSTSENTNVSRANFTGAQLRDVDLMGAIRLAARGLDDVI